MAKVAKVYDFNQEKTGRTLVTALKRRRNESTVADLVAATGLPKYQVEQSIKGVLDEYAGHMKVTESGEILYYFPAGMRSRTRGFVPAAKRFLRKFLEVSGKVLALLFKVWIVVMLVGYFVLFIALLLLALFASVAGSVSSKDSSRSRSRGGGFGSFYLTTRLFDLFIRLWLYSSLTRADPYRPGRAKPKGRPLHKSVFAYVFGDGDPNAGWDVTEKRAVIQFIRSHKGVVSLPEFMALTGKRPDDAELLMNRYLLEYEGEPDVTPGGTLVYRFPELMRTRETAAQFSIESVPRKQLIPFNRNDKGMNTWIGVLNGVNIVFGSYFMYYSFFVDLLDPARALDRFYLFTAQIFSGVGDPALILALGLGLVPFVFSLLFYLIPVVRKGRENKKNEEIRKENYRKDLYAAVLKEPEITVGSLEDTRKESRMKGIERFREQAVKELGALTKVDVAERAEGVFSYSFPELARQREDMETYRKSIDLSKYTLGGTVFDTGE